MRVKNLVLFALFFAFVYACAQRGHVKGCGSCPDHDRKDYIRKHK